MVRGEVADDGGVAADVGFVDPAEVGVVALPEVVVVAESSSESSVM